MSDYDDLLEKINKQIIKRKIVNEKKSLTNEKKSQTNKAKESVFFYNKNFKTEKLT